MPRYPILILLLAALLATGGCTATFFQTVNVGDGSGSVIVERRRVYADELGLSLDVYRPAARDAAAPIVVFFYGGRWKGGSKERYAFVGEALAARGIVAVLPDYRLYPTIRFPGFVEDAARAVSWTREHARAIGGDATRLFVGGHSAGAHIAALLGTDRRYLEAVGMAPKDLAGVVAIAGPHDFLPITDDDLAEIFGPAERYPESQPVNFVDGDEPPFLLLHGTDDKLVWLRNSERLHRRLEIAGIPHEFKRYPDIGHVRILVAMRYPNLAPTLDDVERFVKRKRAD
ncbi:MAG TPA: alpha/beta hydrolase [Xanthomonadales bacterium]|nr:alpha/beta hydrolase [Xanthomonadales bacterium]